MPKKYEDEIREILKGMDDAPRGSGPVGTGRNGGRSGRTSGSRGMGQRPSMPSFQLGNMLRDPQKLMGGALILMLFSWVMQGFGFGGPRGPIAAWAGYVSLASIVLFIVALVAMVRARGGLGGPIGPSEQRWRGQVIRLPNRQPFWTRWWRSVQRTFERRGRGGSGRPGDRGRNSVQW
jgi:hypothetical protein